MSGKIKVAILIVGYNCAENLTYVLAPFFQLKFGIRDDLNCTIIPAPNDIEVKIFCVSALFSEYWDLGFKYDNEKTANLFRTYEESKAIDKFIEIKNSIKDFEARDVGLQWLKQWDFDYLWQWDCDEFGQYNEIINAINWIRRNPLYDFFRINYKNYFGLREDKTYVQDFCPLRIVNNKTHAGIERFRHDNDVYFRDDTTTPDCAGITIPKTILNPIHLSWVFDNIEDARKKIQYQHKQIGTCSYTIIENKLTFDLGYYNKLGIPVPEVYKDEN